MKKVALVMDSCKLQIFADCPRGMVKQIKLAGKDAGLFTFCCAGNWSRDQEYNNGEYSIFQLPDFADFDGAILDIRNMKSRQVVDDLVKRVHLAGIPAVTLGRQVPGLPCIEVDNYAAMTKMMEHLHRQHHVTDLWLLMGPKDHEESRQKEEAIRTYLREQDLAVAEEDVLHSELGVSSGRESFRRLRATHDQLPDVIVCASDAQAIGVCEEAAKDNLRVPEDVAVTGFDCFKEEICYSPSITSVANVGEEMGALAIETLFRLMEGQEVSGKILCEPKFLPGESTGCKTTVTDLGAVMNHQLLEHMETEKYREELVQLQSALMLSRSMRAVAQAVTDHMQSIRGSAFYLVCDPRIYRYSRASVSTSRFAGEGDLSIAFLSRQGFPKEMQVVYAREEPEERELTDQMVSGIFPLFEMRPGEDMLFLPLHFGAYAVGYFAFRNVTANLYRQTYLHVALMAQHRLEELYREKKVTYMNRRLEVLYKTDSLTGIRNRMGYQRDGESLYRILRAKGQRTLALFCDLDHLKEINDTYGHGAGDTAILGVAAALKASCGQNALVSRTGGDEFVVLSPYVSEDELEDQIGDIRSSLREHVLSRHLPYELNVSIGYAVSCNSRDETLEGLIRQADEKMYKEKEKHKKQTKEKDHVNISLSTKG